MRIENGDDIVYFSHDGRLFALKVLRQYHDIERGWVYWVHVHIDGDPRWQQTPTVKSLEHILDKQCGSIYFHK